MGRGAEVSKLSQADRCRQWREKNPDYQREWRAKNPEKARRYSRSYKERNADEVRARNRARMKKRRDADREGYRRAMREWARKNPDKVRAKAVRQHLKTFGLTLEKWQAMHDAQAGVCAICGGKERRGHALSVDHCHQTNKVRGLLCGDCNRGLGLFRDNPEALVRAAEYLRR
jgi:hypothetical protein